MPVAFTLTDYTYTYRSDAPARLAWGAASFELDALRRETVACQLVIQPDQTILAVLGQSPLLNWTPAPRLRVVLGRWRGPDQQQPLTEAFFVGVVPADDGERLVSDPLLRDESIEVPAGCPQAAAPCRGVCCGRWGPPG